jgi:hypothetical protein
MNKVSAQAVLSSAVLVWDTIRTTEILCALAWSTHGLAFDHVPYVHLRVWRPQQARLVCLVILTMNGVVRTSSLESWMAARLAGRSRLRRNHCENYIRR